MLLCASALKAHAWVTLCRLYANPHEAPQHSLPEGELRAIGSSFIWSILDCARARAPLARDPENTSYALAVRLSLSTLPWLTRLCWLRSGSLSLTFPPSRL